MKNQKGQIILMLILVMTVALAIGLSVIQRSLSDISTSSKVEQSSRAFSAAEAGIEKALRDDFNPFSLTDTSVTVTGRDLMPCIPGSVGCAQGVGSPQIPLEYPPLAKEEVVQVWLADPKTLATVFDQASIIIAWGNKNIQNADDKPAIEVTQVYSAGGGYSSQKFYFDSNHLRAVINNFRDEFSNCSDSLSINVIDTTMGSSRPFYCRTSITGLTGPLKLLRVRMLYSNSSQAFAVIPSTGACATCNLPPQARIIESTGVAGGTQRKIQLFQLYKVVPPYFDYGIFSVGEINKE